MTATIPAKFRGRARRDAAAYYVTRLAKGIFSGELAILSGQHESTVATAEFVILDIEVTPRKRGNGVEIKLRWPARPLIRVAATEGQRHG